MDSSFYFSIYPFIIHKSVFGTARQEKKYIFSIPIELTFLYGNTKLEQTHTQLELKMLNTLIDEITEEFN